MEFHVLGPVHAVEGGTDVVLGGSRQRRLLAVLLLGDGRVVGVERIVDAVWGDDERPAGGGAHGAVVRVEAAVVAGLRLRVDARRWLCALARRQRARRRPLRVRRAHREVGVARGGPDRFGGGVVPLEWPGVRRPGRRAVVPPGRRPARGAQAAGARSARAGTARSRGTCRRGPRARGARRSSSRARLVPGSVDAGPVPLRASGRGAALVPGSPASHGRGDRPGAVTRPRQPGAPDRCGRAVTAVRHGRAHRAGLCARGGHRPGQVRHCVPRRPAGARSRGGGQGRARRGRRRSAVRTPVRARGPTRRPPRARQRRAAVRLLARARCGVPRVPLPERRQRRGRLP